MSLLSLSSRWIFFLDLNFFFSIYRQLFDDAQAVHNALSNSIWRLTYSACTTTTAAAAPIFEYLDDPGFN